jgi:hypothetical protein
VRILRDVALYALLVAPIGCVHQAPPVQTFDEVCPADWTFLYTDYTVGRSNGAAKVVCRPPSAVGDSGGRQRTGSAF